MLGKQVKCKITGFEGIATAEVKYINGCIQYCVKPQMNEKGKMPEGEYIDVQQLEVIEDGPEIIPSSTGGDRKETPPRN